jgi:hypothetical protein
MLKISFGDATRDPAERVFSSFGDTTLVIAREYALLQHSQCVFCEINLHGQTIEY